MAVDYVIDLLDRLADTRLAEISHDGQHGLRIQLRLAKGWVLVAEVRTSSLR